MTVRYSTAQAAEILKIDESLVRRYCRDGKLGERIGRNFSITARQLQRFASQPRSVGRKPAKTKGRAVKRTVSASTSARHRPARARPSGP